MKKKEGRKFKIYNKEFLHSLINQGLSVRLIMQKYNHWIDEQNLDKRHKISYYFVWKVRKSLQNKTNESCYITKDGISESSSESKAL